MNSKDAVKSSVGEANGVLSVSLSMTVYEIPGAGVARQQCAGAALPAGSTVPSWLADGLGRGGRKGKNSDGKKIREFEVKKAKRQVYSCITWGFRVVDNHEGNLTGHHEIPSVLNPLHFYHVFSARQGNSQPYRLFHLIFAGCLQPTLPNYTA